MSDKSIHNNRIQARDLARRSSDAFRETYGSSLLGSVAQFQRDEIILGRKVGTGTFSFVYDIQNFNLCSKQSNKYTEEQTKKREAVANSVKHGAKYVMKCLKDKLEVSDDQDLFHCAAQDIVFETEMLAVLSHPNIVKLHGIVDSHHTAFLEGASEYFIILERLDSTLRDKIQGWSKKSFNPSKSLKSLRSSFNSISRAGENSFNPSRSLKSLRRSFSSQSLSLDKEVVEQEQAPTPTSSASASVGEGESGGEGEETTLHSRLRIAASLASAVDCLHSQGIIFRDLKPDNVGFDQHGNLKLFDFGMARFMPQNGDAYDDVHEMSCAGTPRYSAPEVIFHHPYNLKSDVYSFSVVLWEILCLKKPFAQYKQMKDLERAYSKVDSKGLAINRRWPQSIQDIIKSGSSRDLWARPVMSELCEVLKVKGYTSSREEYVGT